MTSDELRELIERGPTDRLVAALGPLIEAERKKLSREVVGLRKEFSRLQKERERLSYPPAFPCPNCGKMLRTGLAKQCFECGKDWHEPKKEGPLSVDQWGPGAERRLKLAVLALGPWSEVQRFRSRDIAFQFRGHQGHRDLLQILSDRKPDWLGKWADKLLEEEFADWAFVRLLVRAQLCPQPQGETYILRMLYGIRNHDGKLSLRDRLLADPDLLDDEVWKIFEVAPVRGTIIYAFDITDERPGDHPCFSWARTLQSLAADGRIDRQRLLAASLGSLLRNTEARNTAWFAKFHELLEPSPQERETLQSVYLQLLSHPVPGVVGLALNALAVLQKAGKLDAAEFVNGVAAVFYLQPKAQPISAVKFLGRMAARKQAPASTIAAPLLTGLTHPATQVQEGILQLLNTLKEEAAEVISAQLPELLASLSPSVQELAAKIVSHVAPVSTESKESSAEASALVAEARQVPFPWRAQAGIDGALQALEGGGELAAVVFDPMAVPRLDPEQRVEPIRSLDELIERLTIAVETLEDPIEFDLLLDGMSRLRNQRPADFEAQIAPLLQRSQTLMVQAFFPTMTGMGLRPALINVVRQWCNWRAPKMPEEHNSILSFLEERLDFQAEQVQENRACPLLACPTHRRGWIDPKVFLQRMQWYEEHGVEPNQHDFIQGCLRLAPDHRAETLAEAKGLRGRFAAAFRYAIGGPLEDPSLPPDILAAAGRARTPFAELVELEGLSVLPGPDAAQPARYFWDGQVSEADAVPIWIPPKALIRVGVRPDVPAPEHVRGMPTVLMHTWLIPENISWSMSGGATIMLRWLGTVWPAQPDSFFVIGIRLCKVSFMEASINRLRAAFMTPLFDPDVPSSEMARLILALALNQAEPEVTGLAVDALIELIRDGRCVGPELGNVLKSLLKADLLKLNRLAKHLDTAARASPLHAHVCAQVVQTLLSELPDLPRDVHHVLGPLLEWLASLSQGTRKDFRPILAKVTGGKARELARRLLQLDFSPEPGRRVLLEALEGRMLRVRRWMALKA